MSNETNYFCDFCKKELNVRDVKWVDVTHRPPEWELKGRKVEDYHFCKKCHMEFLTILRKRSSKGICGICIFAYCCSEPEKNDCDHVSERKVIHKWWKIWRPK